MALEYEFEGKTVQKALKKASQALDIPEEKLRHDVISYGSTGIFGLVGSKKAKIRVIVPKKKVKTIPESAPAPVDGDLQYEKASEKIIALVDSTFEPEKEADDAEDLTSFLKAGEDALRHILDAISEDTSIKTGIQKETLCYDVEGGNSGVLIGKRGQTLEAIQYLIEKIVNKQSEKRIAVRVDVQGYLSKRRGTLKSMAEKLAEKAKKTGKPMTIGQMNAHDRRVVHLALKNDGAVRTQSMGSGFLRKLVIFPKKASQKEKKGREKKPENGKPQS